VVHPLKISKRIVHRWVTFSLSGSMVMIVFQSIFRAEMHQSDFFFFKLFFRLAYQNNSKHIKKLIFFKRIKFL